jgi:hypothetical protein
MKLSEVIPTKKIVNFGFATLVAAALLGDALAAKAETPDIFTRIEGDKLVIESVPAPEHCVPGKTDFRRIVWERETFLEMMVEDTRLKAKNGSRCGKTASCSA